MHFFILLLCILVISACTTDSGDDTNNTKLTASTAPQITAGATLTYTLTPPSYSAHYTDWTSANVANGSAIGTITLDNGNTVAVKFQAYNPDGSNGQLNFAQTTPGPNAANFWIPSEPYISSEVPNAPPDSDLLSLQGGLNQTYVVTFSEAVKDPIMSIVSLGNVSIEVTYVFDTPFDIISQGVGFYGGGPDALKKLPGNILSGKEGHGSIRFLGTFPSFSWTVPTTENWHGFTFAIRTTASMEPSVIDSQIAITDANDNELTSATVTISDGFSAGDRLMFSNQNGISGTYDETIGELSLRGQTSISNYQTALRSVSYSTTSNDPTLGGSVASRTISWIVTDANAEGLGAESSNEVTSTIILTTP